MPEKIVYGTKEPRCSGSLDGGESRLRDLGLTKGTVGELLKSAGGPRVPFEVVARPQSDEVRCRQVATQLAIGEKLFVAQSTPPIKVAKIMFSLHADENEVHDWVVGILASLRCVRSRKDRRVGVHSPSTRHVPAWVLLETVHIC